MPGKILVVDDNDQNRILLHDVLTHHGYDVLMAAEGFEGVSMAEEHQPDLILMDIQMPGMDGITAGKLLRGNLRTQGIRILALSAFNLLEDEENFFDTGFDGYIDKPINFRKLPETVSSYLTGRETG
ncbi:MAG TPA: response regulator [Geobacteraceae bacterium]|nr:response regulator [Geobacteraceae bacterium]